MAEGTACWGGGGVNGWVGNMCGLLDTGASSRVASAVPLHPRRGAPYHSDVLCRL